MLYESTFASTRKIFTDGRDWPKDPAPTFAGYSIGKWSDADIKKALTEGVTPTGGKLSPPMPYPFFKAMTADDLDAVVAYIRTIPPIANKVERTDFQKKAFPWPG